MVTNAPESVKSPSGRLRRPPRQVTYPVRFLGRACLERSFITLDDAQLLVACLAQLERADEESRRSLAGALRRLRLERAARRLETPATAAPPRERWPQRG